MISSRAPGLVALTAALTLAVAAASCGDDDTLDTGETTFRPKATITIAAPTSLQPAFDRLSSNEGLVTHKFFAGSDFHAQKVRDGDLPDLYAADDPALAQELFDDGLVREPVPFATDELVIAVPDDSRIQSIEDLAEPGVRIAIGQEGLPSGDYARAALAGLPEAESTAILGNVSSETPNNNAIVIALNEGKADAGFVYASDVFASNRAGGKLREIGLPANAGPEVVYVAAIVEDAPNIPGADRFLDALLGEQGAKTMERAGLGPPPG